VPYSCQKCGMDVEMRVLVQNPPSILFPFMSRVKPSYPLKQEKGGKYLPPKHLVHGPVCKQ